MSDIDPVSIFVALIVIIMVVGAFAGLFYLADALRKKKDE